MSRPESPHAVQLSGITLLIPEKPDIERDAVAGAWRAAGGSGERLGRFWEPPALDPAATRVYGNDTFALVVAQKLGLDLLSPPDALLAELPEPLVKRRIERLPLSAIDRIVFPRFVKSAVPKMVRAAVYENALDLSRECAGLEPATVLLASEIVTLKAELRAFVLDGAVLDLALYEGASNLDDAVPLLRNILATGLVPRACVLDLGFVSGRGWLLIEANAALGGWSQRLPGGSHHPGHRRSIRVNGRSVIGRRAA